MQRMDASPERRDDPRFRQDYGGAVPQAIGSPSILRRAGSSVRRLRVPACVGRIDWLRVGVLPFTYNALGAIDKKER